MSSEAAGDAVKEEKKYECEGSFTFVLKDASKLGNKSVFSPIHTIGGFDWVIGMYRDDKKDGKPLAVSSE